MTTDTKFITSGVRALTEIAWMAKRQVGSTDMETSRDVREACWLLAKMARTLLGEPRHEMSEAAPGDDRAAELQAIPQADAVQWIVNVLHPLAHAYADGRSTYAPGMFNDATRTLRAAGFSLDATEAMGKSVWVVDGMGDTFLSLNAAEIAERNRARAS